MMQIIVRFDLDKDFPQIMKYNKDPTIFRLQKIHMIYRVLFHWYIFDHSYLKFSRRI